MTTSNHNSSIVQVVDKETIRTLASLPRENQVFVKGIILGLCNQVAPAQHVAQQARP